MMATLTGAPYGQTETGAQYEQANRYAADMAWVEQLVADSPKLRATRREFFTLAGQLWVSVQGGHWEAHAWQVAIGGLIRPSFVDGNGVLRQMIFGPRVHVEVVDDPSKAGA